ncbi:hypothetical protein [Nostoc sp.]|uniref:hypothetical protein n=1 Tax=Nostoc sp. TaxID=1180 RepID=UPI002FFAAB1B
MRLQFDNKINSFPETSRLTLTGDAPSVANAKKSLVVLYRETMHGNSSWGATALVAAGSPGCTHTEKQARRSVFDRRSMWRGNPYTRWTALPPHWLTTPENLRVNLCFYC